MRLTVSRILLTLGVLTVTVTCIALGFWQLDRLDARRSFNASVQAAMELPTVELDSRVLAEISRNPSEYLYRRVRASGWFVDDLSILLRGRSDQGRPGVHLVTPMRLEDGVLVLINRGWLPAPDGATVDPRPYDAGGKQTVRGSLQEMPGDIDDPIALTVETEGHRVDTYLRLDRETLSWRFETPLPPLYVLADSAATDGGLPLTVPPPALDDGPHLGYAIQWFSFAAIALFGFTAVAITRWRKGPVERQDGIRPPPLSH